MPNIIVVGAGPAGLAIALGLSRSLKDVTVDVLEKHESFSVKGSTLGLAVNGSKALKEIVGNEAIVDETLLSLGLHLPYNDGRMLAWYIIRDWLLERVREKSDSITLHMGMTLVSIEDDENNEFVKVHCKERDLEGHMVVAADGVHSQVRTLLGLPPAEYTGKQIWRGCVQIDKEQDPPELVELLDRGLTPFDFRVFGNASAFSAFNHHPMLDRTLTWVFSSSKPHSSKDEETLTPWQIIEPLIDTTDHDYDAIKGLLKKSAPHELNQSYPLSVVDMDSQPDGQGWGGRGRVTIIGDAAHAMRPTSGQGTSLALEDCAVLCRHLSQTNTFDYATCKSMIRAFENERRERVRRIWYNEKQAAEATYTGKPVPPPTQEYLDWVARGV